MITKTVRSFEPGDKVLVLLPVVGSNLLAQFAGPYSVEQNLSDKLCDPNPRPTGKV